MRLKLGCVRAALLVVLALTAAACGDDGSPFDQLGAPDSLPDADSGSSGDDDPAIGDGLDLDLTPVVEEIPFAVGRSFWHSGFAVEIGDGLFYGEERLSGDVLHYVTLDATFENLGPDSASFFFIQVALVVDGVAAIEASDLAELPSVPSGLTAAGSFAFIVEPDFAPENTEVRIGAAGEEIAVVPLGDDPAGHVTLEPRSLDSVDGTITLELIDLEITGAELRADIPALHEAVPEGKRALTLTFDVTSRRSGNWSIFADNFALVLPSGNAVGVDGATLNNLPGDESGIATPDHSIRFLIDADAAGTYGLRFTAPNAFLGDEGAEEATLEFSIS